MKIKSAESTCPRASLPADLRRRHHRAGTRLHSGPWIQPGSRINFTARRSGEQTVLASSRTPSDTSQSPAAAIDPNNFVQLTKLAMQGDPAAENALGLLYAQGDEKQAIKPDDAQAAAWFTKAAEHGNISAQYKLGLLIGRPHGLPKDANKAYSDSASPSRRPTRQQGPGKSPGQRNDALQAAAIEQQAELWYQQHEPHGKPNPAH